MFDVVTLQETQWPFTREWSTASYWVIHSGSQSRAGGVLTLISRKLVSQDNLSWAEEIPGRLLWIRLHSTHRDHDILNCYQYVSEPH